MVVGGISMRFLFLGCAPFLALGTSANALELRYEIHVFFDRDRFVPGDATKSPFLFRHVGSNTPLDEKPIPLAINDVVRIGVEAKGSGTFAIEHWERVEAWTETRRSWLRTTKIEKKLTRTLPVNGSLNNGAAYVGVRFPDKPDMLDLKNGVQPRVVDKPGQLVLTGIVNRLPPDFTLQAGHHWEGEPKRSRDLKDIASTPLYTLTVIVRR
jgi:hypothetical protein